MTETVLLALLPCGCLGNLHNLPASSLLQDKQMASQLHVIQAMRLRAFLHKISASLDLCNI